MEKRKIKFRCWNKSRKELVYGVDVYDEGLAFEGTDDNPFDFDENTLGQYVFTQKSTGKEIYEFDVVKIDDVVGMVVYGMFESSHEGGYSTGHYHYGFYIVNDKNEQIFDSAEDIDWENIYLIGNIWENKEELNHSYKWHTEFSE